MIILLTDSKKLNLLICRSYCTLTGEYGYKHQVTFIILEISLLVAHILHSPVILINSKLWKPMNHTTKHLLR